MLYYEKRSRTTITSDWWIMDNNNKCQDWLGVNETSHQDNILCRCRNAQFSLNLPQAAIYPAQATSPVASLLLGFRMMMDGY
jgi:hypothetical protein